MGFTLQQYRDELRVDLKDSSTLWSDAELNRCVFRAVDDLSRFVPLEKVHEETLDFTVTDEDFVTPTTMSATAIVNAQSIASTVDGEALTIADNTPDVPRRLTLTLTSTTIAALTVIIKGYDQDGNYIEESYYLPTLVSGTAKEGNLYFKRVIQVEVDNIANAGAGDTISVGTGQPFNSHIFLANKPIKPGSETVTNTAGTTTFTKDTDYTMDYINGTIRYMEDGSMESGSANPTGYLIDYTKSRLGIDISSVIPVITRIQKVEYPANLVPQQFVNFNIFGNFMHIGPKLAGKSQEEMSTAKDHLAIYYERKHMPPGEGSPGSYPDVLDEVICIGASAYALLIMALKYEHQAVTDIAHVDTALDKVATYLETNDTTDNAKDVLANITDDVALLREAISKGDGSGALDAANAYLDDVDTTDLGKATTGAEALLDTGDDKINTVNVGNRVPENYREYSGARVAIANARISSALGFVQEAAVRLSNIGTYIEEAGAWMRMGEDFIAEAGARIQNVGQYLILSDRFRIESLERRNEFWSILRDKAEYRKRVSSVPVRQPA